MLNVLKSPYFPNPGVPGRRASGVRFDKSVVASSKLHLDRLQTATVAVPRETVGASRMCSSSDAIAKWSWRSFLGDTPMVYVLYLGMWDANTAFVKVGGHGFDRETKTGFDQRSRGHAREFRQFGAPETMRYTHFVLLDAQHVGRAEARVHDFCRQRFRQHRGFEEVYMMPWKMLHDADSDFVQCLRQVQTLYRGHNLDYKRQLHEAEDRVRQLEARLDEHRRHLLSKE